MRRVNLVFLLAAALIAARAPAQNTSHFHYSGNTGSNATIAIPVSVNPNISGIPLVGGDEIGVFTSGGLCAGAVVWLETDAVVTVWGDNSLTPEADGLAASEQMRFRVWSSVRNTEYSLVSTSYASGNGLYSANGIYILSRLSAEAPPEKPSLVFPPNGSGNTATSLTPNWNNLARASVYHLQIATDIGFNQLVVDNNSVLQPGVFIGPLQKSTVFYWRVRGENAAGPGAWSDSWSFITTAVSTPVHFTFTTGTGSNCTIALPVSINPRIGDCSLAPGDEVAAYSPAGLCVGATVWEGNNTALTVWGDNAQTTPVDGMLSGESVSFRVWRMLTGVEYQSVSVAYSSGNGSFAADQISVFSSLVANPVFVLTQSNSSIDFGIHPLGSTVQDTVDLLNGVTSTDTLVVDLSGISSPFSLVAPVARVSLVPGALSHIVLRYSPGTQSTQPYGISRDTLVMSTSGGTRTVVLSGESPYPRIQADPFSLNFGEVALGSERLLTVVLSNPSINALAIDTVFTSKSEYGVAWTGKVIGAGGSTSLGISFAPTQGEICSDTLVIRCNSESGSMRIPLTGLASAPRMTVSVTGLSFGDIAVGDSIMRALWIHNASLSPLSLSSAVCSTSAFLIRRTFPVVIAGNDSLQLPVVFKPQKFGSSGDTLAISSDGGTVRIALGGQSSTPTIILSQSTFDFGQRQINVPVVLEGWISNTSVNALVIDSVVLRSTQFRIDTGRFVVPGFDTLFLRTTFTPDRYGLFGDIVALYHNALSSPTLILLKGACPQAQLVVDLTLLDFGEHAVRDSVAMHRVIRNMSINPLTISRVRTSDLFFHIISPASATVPANDSIQVLVFFRPMVYGSLFIDSLWVESNVGLVAIPLAGASPPPVVTPQPESVDFGSVKRGTTSATVKIRLTNSSVNVAELDSVYTLSNHFSAAWLVGSKSIPRGDTGTVYLLFMPDSVGLFVDSAFAVFHGVPAKVAIPVRGIGTPTTSVTGQNGSPPVSFALLQNFPNPFNSETVITYELSKASMVSLKVYDVMGREVAVLVEEIRGAGGFGITWNAARVTSGMYFCRLEAISTSDVNTRFVQTRKMILMK